MSQPRRSVAAFVAVLIASVAMVLVAPVASAQPPGWPSQLTIDFAQGVTMPSGKVLVGGTRNGQPVMQVINADGSLGTTYDDPVYYSMFEGGVTVGADDTIYTVADDVGEGARVVALRGGTTLWSHTVTFGCSGSTNISPKNIAADATGRVYVVGDISTRGQCDSRIQLLVADQSGILGNASLAGNPSLTALSVTEAGVTVAGNDAVQRFDTLARESAPATSVSALAGEELDAVTVGATGNAFYAYRKQVDGVDPGCFLTEVRSRVLGVTAAGQTWNHDFPSCTGASLIQATPNGGVATVYRPDPQATGDGPAFAMALQASGANKWSAPYQFYMGGDPAVTGIERFINLRVDNNGSIVIDREYHWNFDNKTGRGRMLEFVSGASGTRDAIWFSHSALAGEDGNDASVVVGLAPGKVVLHEGSGNTLYKADRAGLGLDYPRDAGVGIQPAAPEALEYVALGDSFSSGEGNPPFEPGTELGEDAHPDGDGCHRSSVAYPHLLDQDPTLPLVLGQGKFKACGGAVTDDIADTRPERSPHYGLELQHKTLSASTDVMTVSAGGNDAGLTEFIKKCVLPGVDAGCDVNSQEFRASDAFINGELKSRLRTVYTTLLTQASNAKLYVVGYPHVVAVTTEPNAPLYCSYLSANERSAARSFIQDLNTAAQTTVTALESDNPAIVGRIEFINPTGTGSPFIGHEICDGDAFFHGLVLSPDGSILNPDDEYSFHPNINGQKAYYELIRSRMN
ncbi:hypothetical protein JNJ66_02755 [Candidatus Saccharibacteria bacterium]|nr:hypothetical protein [Candidatus Saccharibacteria bacterium]